MTHYDRLSALDAAFLDFEDENVHMHIGVALLFEPGPLATAEGALDVERLRAYTESRLHRMPRYRQRLAWIPFERHPVWVDDPRFNLFYHVRHTCLPKPGSIRQLKRLCGRLLSQKLDRTKPLWETWVIEGVEGGRFALVAKAHHCMVDGVGGVDLLAALLSPTPEADFEPALPWVPRPAPSGLGLVRGEIERGLRGVRAAIDAGARALGRPGQVLHEAGETVSGLVGTLGSALRPASETPLNPVIGPHRRFDWLRLDLDAVKDVKRHFEATVNDVVLATVAGAVREFLARRGTTSFDGLDFRALVPVNVRSSAQDPLGNRVSEVIARLPVGEPDPVRRLHAVCETMSGLKRSHQIEATAWAEELSDWLAAPLLGAASRIAAARRAFNLVVTNVPGPQVPLYLLGAPLREVYPMVPLFTNQALGVGLFSYDGGLYFGLNADWDEMPDLHAFVDALDASFAALRDAAATGRAASASG